MKYKRVLPRDLFNEASLLKCLGRLALLIIDGKADCLLEMTHMQEEQGFIIEQDRSSGDLFCRNVYFKTAGGRATVMPWRPLNTRDEWPLYVSDEDGSCEVAVFDNQGNLSDDFIQWCQETP